MGYYYTLPHPKIVHCGFQTVQLSFHIQVVQSVTHLYTVIDFAFVHYHKIACPVLVEIGYFFVFPAKVQVYRIFKLTAVIFCKCGFYLMIPRSIAYTFFGFRLFTNVMPNSYITVENVVYQMLKNDPTVVFDIFGHSSCLKVIVEAVNVVFQVLKLQEFGIRKGVEF